MRAPEVRSVGRILLVFILVSLLVPFGIGYAQLNLTNLSANPNYEDYFKLVELDPSILLSTPIPTYLSSELNVCGVVAIRSVLGYYGIEKTAEEIKNAVGFNAYAGVRPAELRYYLISQGLNAYTADGRDNETAYTELKNYVSLDMPVIVVQRMSATNSLLHYRTVIGFYNSRKTGAEYVIYMDQRGVGFIGKEEFLGLWTATKNKMIAIARA